MSNFIFKLLLHSAASTLIILQTVRQAQRGEEEPERKLVLLEASIFSNINLNPNKQLRLGQVYLPVICTGCLSVYFGVWQRWIAETKEILSPQPSSALCLKRVIQENRDLNTCMFWTVCAGNLLIGCNYFIPLVCTHCNLTVNACSCLAGMKLLAAAWTPWSISPQLPRHFMLIKYRKTNKLMISTRLSK